MSARVENIPACKFSFQIFASIITSSGSLEGEYFLGKFKWCFGTYDISSQQDHYQLKTDSESHIKEGNLVCS